MRIWRGAKKGKKTKGSYWVASSNKWHRLDPTNGQRTACGVPVGYNWSHPYFTTTGEPPVVKDLGISGVTTREVCKIPECFGVSTKEQS